jgi:ATP-binding cassette, subfamily B (MDR/TAP), member 1
VLGILFSRVLEAFQLPHDERIQRVDFFSLMFFVVAIGNWIIYFTIGWLTNLIAQWSTYDIRLRMFNDMLKQDLAFFDKPQNSTGALAAKLSTYPTNLQELLGFNLALLLIIVVNLISTSVLAIAVGWKLGLVVVFGALPLLVLSGYLKIRLEFKLNDDTSARFSQSASLAAEAIGEIRTVSAFTLEGHILNKYCQTLQEVQNQSVRALLWTMFWYAMTQSILFLTMALGFWYGGRLLSTGEYSTTQFYIVFISVIFSGEAAAEFASYTTSITKAQSAANYIFWLRSFTPKITEDISKRRTPEDNEKDPAASIQCKDVSFAYPLEPNTPVLHSITVSIRPGRTTAFVGASGSGKTTIMTLLERFYDPTSGIIAMDQTPITDFCPRQYRRGIGLVQQEPVLYGMTIKENIALGLDNGGGGGYTHDSLVSSKLSDADITTRIESACRDANIFDFITSLPSGFGTLCGSKGTQLSGGQKQRIAIARALVRNPRLLLLDEATSALDTESERAVQGALDEAGKGRSTVVIAHRLSTIRGADVIVVIHEGKIAEMGNHDDLASKRGLYHDMCLAQALDK